MVYSYRKQESKGYLLLGKLVYQALLKASEGLEPENVEPVEVKPAGKVERITPAE
jgi:hypothetical protein